MLLPNNIKKKCNLCSFSLTAAFFPAFPASNTLKIASTVISSVQTAPPGSLHSSSTNCRATVPIAPFRCSYNLKFDSAS